MFQVQGCAIYWFLHTAIDYSFQVGTNFIEMDTWSTIFIIANFNAVGTSALFFFNQEFVEASF